jgi:aerobic-type carbon monoxide dehydrogenase small subunit (CoxS/CutS family)
MPIAAKPFERHVTFTLDGSELSFSAWSDTPALWAIHYLGKAIKPKRGCEMGQCGTCESLLDGVPTRLCQLPATSLDGVAILTRP